MPELWDIYDKNRKKTGKTARRDIDELKEGEYHIITVGIIMNSKNQLLITKRAPHKKLGLMWEFSGGSVQSGETSLEGILRELKEEIGVQFTKKDAIFLEEKRKETIPSDFKDMWLFRKDVKDEEITFPDGEAIDYKWVTIDEFLKMCEQKEVIPTVDFGLDEYNKALKM